MYTVISRLAVTDSAGLRLRFDCGPGPMRLQLRLLLP